MRSLGLLRAPLLCGLAVPVDADTSQPWEMAIAFSASTSPLPGSLHIVAAPSTASTHAADMRRVAHPVVPCSFLFPVLRYPQSSPSPVRAGSFSAKSSSEIKLDMRASGALLVLLLACAASGDGTIQSLADTGSVHIAPGLARPLGRCFLRAAALRGGSRSGGRPAQEKICIVGSGNWGCAIARVLGHNAAESEAVCTDVTMWVYEEVVDGRNLSDIINAQHENPKYLPGVQLPSNVVAVPDLAAAVSDATVLVWVLPHQFLARLLPTVKAAMRHDALSVSLIKGMAPDKHGRLTLVSSTIAQGLGIDEVAVLMGANVADQVARDALCEATLGCADAAAAAVLVSLFDRPMFRVRAVPDVAGVEVCGALKNVVALGAGFADGLQLGSNTKAAVMRLGALEMRKFAKLFYPSAQEATMWESCGIADLITTCFDGRNRLCAERFASAQCNDGWGEIEALLLGGQKLQGPATAQNVHDMLEQAGVASDFPLLRTICDISAGRLPAKALVDHASTYY